jgi:hypothetical protein
MSGNGRPQVGDPRTLIVSANRLAALKKALDEIEEAINSSRALRIEINCGVDEFTIAVMDVYKFAHRPASDDLRRFCP